MGPNHKSKGHKGRLTGHTLSRFRLRLDGYAPKLVYKSIPCPRVGGDQEEWPADHVDARLTVHHIKTDSIKLVEALLDLYIRILMVELIHNTLFLSFSTCKYSSLVVEAQEKPCRESSLRSSSESSLRDR
jgi:hypothetical protein